MKVKCYICGKSVDLMEARSGADSKPCHGDCFLNGYIKEVKNETR